MSLEAHMILIEGAPYSIELWCWFNENKHLARISPETPLIATAFEGLFPSDWGYATPRDYNKLKLGEFWKLVWEIFMMASGIGKGRVRRDVSFSVLRGELTNIKCVALRWSFRGDIKEVEVGDFDHIYFDKENQRVKQTFRYQVYYVFRHIFEVLDELESSVPAEISEIQLDKKTSLQNTSEPSSFFCELIREKSKGDLDEFIIYTIQHIQFKAITQNHEKLALLFRYLKTDNAKFDERLTPGEAWRFIFPTFFDDFEDVYDKFYNEFTNDCVMYFLSDYVSEDYGIKHIRFYNLYYATGLSEGVLGLLQQKKVLSDIARIERSYCEN